MKKKKNIIILFIILLVSFSIYVVNEKYELKKQRTIVNEKMISFNNEKKVCDVSCFLSENDSTITFLTDVIGIDKDTVIQDLVLLNKNKEFDKLNIGRLEDEEGNLRSYNFFETGLIEYLFKYAKENPESVDNTYIPYDGNAEYVESLIKYFTKFYPDVDYLTAISIGAAESGYYKVRYMLNYNNIYGGMSGGKLIVYKNIEYGVLTFIRFLNNSYYSKGVVDLQNIGRSYCPAYDENGNKIASQHWVNLVNNAKNHYADTTNDIDILDIIERES